MCKRKRCSNRAQARETVYFPEEVVTRILAKLRVKTLLRFRCVSKSWCSIIDSPHFVNLYGNLFDSTKLIALECFGSYGDGGCMLTIRKSDSLRKINTVFKTSETYYLEGQCDSLLLLQSDTFGVDRVRIWNPSIRKSLLLPPCPLLPCIAVEYILGFAQQSGDYKIIAFSFGYAGHRGDYLKTRVAVYTLNDRQWVVRDNALNVDYNSFARFSRYCSFEGAAHWLGNHVCDGPIHRPNHHVSLDYDTEKVTISELPQSLDDTDSWRSLFLLRESLAILCVSHVITKIWVLKQEEDGKRGWTLWFSGPLIRDDLVSHLHTFNSMDIHGGRISVLYHGGDGGYIIFGKVSYSIDTGQLHLRGKSISRHLKLETYCESLVLSSGFKTEDMT